MAAYKSSNGNWVSKFYYLDWKGERHQKKKEGFKTKKDAIQFETDFLEKRKENSEILFDKLVDNYLEDFKVRFKITTYDSNFAPLKSQLFSGN